MQITRIINNTTGSGFYSANQTTVQSTREMNRSQEAISNSTVTEGGATDRGFLQISERSKSAERLSFTDRVQQVKELSRDISNVLNKENTIDHKLLFLALGTPPKSTDTVKNLGNFIDRIA